MSNFAPVAIPDGDLGLDPKDYHYPPDYEGHLKSVMVTNQQIRDRVKELAKLIHEDYKGDRVVLLCVLKGAAPFCQHLSDALQELKHGYCIEFLRCKSYEGTSSSGRIEIGGGLDYDNLKGKNVIVVEDIVDTGTTLSRLLPVLQEKGAPKSLEVVSLLEKRLDHPAKARSKYTGFSIPNHFIIGYGLDFNELYRDLSDIWVISQEGIDNGGST